MGDPNEIEEISCIADSSGTAGVSVAETSGTAGVSAAGTSETAGVSVAGGGGGGEGTGFSVNGPSGVDQRIRDANMKLPFKCLLMSTIVLHIMSKW